jgi:hypothetical protein
MPPGASQVVDEFIDDGREAARILVLANSKSLAKMRARQEAALSADIPIRFQRLLSIESVNRIERLENVQRDWRIVTEDGTTLRTDVPTLDNFYEQLTDRIPGVSLVAFRDRDGVGDVGLKINPSDTWAEDIVDGDIGARVGFDKTWLVTIVSETMVGEL